MTLRALAAILGVLLAAGPAAAQGFNMSRDNTEQIQVYADQGIEWQSETNRVVARGNAKAVRGKVTLTADSLTAYYRDGPGGNEIWRIDADGDVSIYTDKETATGYKATYDLDKAIFVLRGKPATLKTPTDTVTATDTLEYWEKERMAVARGDAVVTQPERTLKGDVVTAHFKDGKKGGMEIRRADAYGHVDLKTAKEQVFGEKADYNVDGGIATVTGSVRILRDGNELQGAYAHVDLNSGISKLFGTGPGGRGDGRVHGTFTPEKKDGEQKEGGARATFAGPGSNKSTQTQGK